MDEGVDRDPVIFGPVNKASEGLGRAIAKLHDNSELFGVTLILEIAFGIGPCCSLIKFTMITIEVWSLAKLLAAQSF